MWLRASASRAALGCTPNRSQSSCAVDSSGSGTSTHTQPSSRSSRAGSSAASARRAVPVSAATHTTPMSGPFRTLAHRMLDDSLDHIAGRRDEPVWRPMPDAVRSGFDGPLPRSPEGLEAAYDDFRRTVVPYSMGNDHPRFWGWYMGPGNPVGNLADLLASVLNPNLGGADHAPVLVEQQVVRWCAEAAGYPTSASGLLVSGASEANLLGLAVARTERIGTEVRTDGIRGNQRYAVYASSEVHSCHRKSVGLLGLGESSLRIVPVRPDFTMDVDALAAAVAADRADGIVPLAVVATVGTINTGSVDDVEAVADLAEREGLWLHV